MNPDPETRPAPPRMPLDTPLPDSPPAEADEAVDIAGTEADEEAVGEALEGGRRSPARPGVIDETASAAVGARSADAPPRAP